MNNILGRLTLGALTCVALAGIALSLAVAVLIAPVHVALGHAEPAPLPVQSLEVEPVSYTETRDSYDVVVPIDSPTQLVMEDGDPETGGPFLTKAPITCQEDEPCWDCRFDGNQRCGVQIEGVWYIIQFRDGSPEGVTYR